MVTPSGLGNTRLTWSVLGTNDSKREDTSRHHGRESRSLPDPATSYKPDQHANCRRTQFAVSPDKRGYHPHDVGAGQFALRAAHGAPDHPAGTRCAPWCAQSDGSHTNPR